MRQAGFTLLEMIVVLAILGLATALVAPSAIRGIDSWRRQAQLDSLRDQVRALPGNARASGRRIVLSDATLKGADAPLRIAAEWTLSVPRPWKVNANGVCEGGQIAIGNRHGSRTLSVGSPFCDPTLRP
ncbi:MAG TPA: type II secretion system protein [Thermomonas sp.]|nr:type II secretion system protein [Thermomonas sp.]